MGRVASLREKERERGWKRKRMPLLPRYYNMIAPPESNAKLNAFSLLATRFFIF